MESIQSKVEAWIKEQRAKLLKVSWGPLQWRMKWPWLGKEGDREHRRRIHQEYERRRKQLHDLCSAVKADSVSDLQDILSCMVLSECVYKRPASDLVWAVNKFQSDFGGQIVSLERVQPSSDHVPHSYLLAESGDTLFASFIGTKQYKDVMADANIFQGAIFHEDVVEDTNGTETTKCNPPEKGKGNGENLWNPLESKANKAKPAAHRGFLARAKGIPALELYRLAQKKKRNLVLCGHSLGGAVAVLATLAILRVVASSSSSLKENGNVKVKCITFSQPPVGNAALRDYVSREGWQHYFKSYCIPEDLVPRILSPAYFHHYNAQSPSVPAETGTTRISMLKSEEVVGQRKENDGEQLVLGLGPVQTSMWRLSKLVPLEGIRRQFNKYRGKKVDSVETSFQSDSVATTVVDDDMVEPQSLEIQEGSDGISLKPISETDKEPPGVAPSGKSAKKSSTKNGDSRTWRRVPYLPSYVPFGELYLLDNSSVKSLSDAEYSKLTSVRSVIAELRERFQSHSMKSYRFRFQRIYDLCMKDDTSPFSAIEQLPQFPHLQQWLGLAVAGTVELGHIVESPVIRTATSVAPLGWNGIPGEKNIDPFKVDITGYGLHLCTLVHAQVNGNWCSTTVESFPSTPAYSSNCGENLELQKMRVLIGAPLKQPPKHQMEADSMMHVFSAIDSNTAYLNREHTSGPYHEEKSMRPEGLSEFFIFCTSDFTTVSKEVHVRTRRVRLLGLEGAGKTSLFKAILSQGRITHITNIENLLPETDAQEGISHGLCFCDSAGVNLQELNLEATRFRDELWTGIRDLNRKTDLIVLVHNLSHRIPHLNHSNGSQQKPALTLLLDEAKSLGIPWVLAVTNKFSVSAHQQKAAIDDVVQSYQASPSTTAVINSCPYVMPSAASPKGIGVVEPAWADAGKKMGSGGSKATTSSALPSLTSSLPSSTSSFGGNGRNRRRRSKSKCRRLFKSSSCLRLGTKSRSHHCDNEHQVCNHRNKERRNNDPCASLNDTEPDHANIECFRKIKVEQPDEMPCITPNVGLNECAQASITDTASITASSSAQPPATPTLNPSSCFLSRFSFIPGNVSFRLSRATSVGSSRSYPLSSTSLTILNNVDELHLHARPASSLIDTDESQQANGFLPESQVNRMPTHIYNHTSGNVQLNTRGSVFSAHLQDNQTNSSRCAVGRNANGAIMGVGVNSCSTRIHNEIGSNRTRPSDRRSGAREPVERNVRFSRTLSVGRLRNRVLRRSSLSDSTFSSLQQEVRDTNQRDDTRSLEPDGNVVNSENGSGYSPSNMSSSLFGIQDYGVETSRPREAGYHDLLEHRSNFLERRRRIRSQVRALQRLGSRFENVSGHERSCILSGQQRTGHCTCRTSNRDARPNDDNSARASISRIVMLAEALFEVLDEIHQQSVVLSSRPSVSSIGSVPAPNEVVESLPVKLFSKLQKNEYEEAAQCYICLVEYEEGDRMRILPCRHEFHKTCIDKWLKEIHRVCPLCRRDICRSDALPAEN